MTQSTKSLLPLICLGLVGTGFDFALHAPEAPATEGARSEATNAAPVRPVIKALRHKLSASGKQG